MSEMQPYLFNESLNISDNYYYDDFLTNDTEYLDYEVATLSKNMHKVLFSICIYSLIFLIGLAGNLLIVISVLRFRALQTITNLFLLSLATADLLLILFCVPIKISEFLSNSWPHGRLLCKLSHYIQNVSAMSSVLHLVVISFERYFAILHPLVAKFKFTRGRAHKIICFIWLVSFLIATPLLIGKSTVVYGNTRIQVEHCVRVWSRKIYWQLFELYRALIILIIPMCILTIVYSLICKQLWLSPRERFNREYTKSTSIRMVSLKRQEEVLDDGLSNQSTLMDDSANDVVRSRNENIKMRKIIKMLISVVCMFFICWMPITITNMLTSFNLISLYNEGFLWYLRNIFFGMCYANSCMNPFVYAFMSKSFRASFKASCFNKKSTKTKQNV